MEKTRSTIFTAELSQAYHTVSNREDIPDVHFPQYRGLTFKEFWYLLNKEQDIKMEYYDYEEELELAFRESKYHWVKKSTGLGITEFMLRWIAWNCLKDDVWKNKQIDVNVVFVTGPRIHLAITIMQRLKALFPDLLKTKETKCILNGNVIEAFPSHHVATAHGLNPQLVLFDEGDFFPPNQQKEAREMGERYIAKTNPVLAWVSTPYLPGGLFQEIEKEKECLYRRKIMLLDRALKAGRYTQDQVDVWKQSPSFMREAWGEYGYGVGDIFVDFDSIIEKYNLNYLGGQAGTYADPAFGSSKFGKVCGEVRDGVIYVTEAEEYTRESPSAMLQVIEESWGKHRGHCKVDAAHPGFIKDLNERGIPALAVAFGSQVPEHEGLTQFKDSSYKSESTITLKKKLPINGSMMVKRRLVRIHPDFTDLISQMRAVKFDKKGGIDKEEVPFDLVDAFNMMCWDLKQFDYRSIGITSDGRIIDENKKLVSKGVHITTRVVE